MFLLNTRRIFKSKMRNGKIGTKCTHRKRNLVICAKEKGTQEAQD